MPEQKFTREVWNKKQNARKWRVTYELIEGDRQQSLF
jgi:hypothetical protein